jgi:hypothetical protein
VASQRGVRRNHHPLMDLEEVAGKDLVISHYSIRFIDSGFLASMQLPLVFEKNLRCHANLSTSCSVPPFLSF